MERRLHVRALAFAKAKANQAAAVAGFDVSDYDTVLYYHSKVVNCDFSGIADNHSAFINGALRTSILAQELGHTIGNGHGLALRCRDANGTRVTLSNHCDIVEYGDPFNASGSGTGSFAAVQQFELGWMSGRIQDVSTDGGTFRLEPLENGPPGVQALRVHDFFGSTLWLEYRQPIGVDSSLSPTSAGVQLREQRPNQGGRDSYLLDMTPGTPTFVDARMPVGTTWVNPRGILKITVDSSDPSGATITIADARPKVRDVRGLAVDEATEVLASTGLRVGPIGSVVDCDNIGRVVSQNPAPGAHLAPGSAVDLKVGTRPAPPRICF